MRFPIAALFFVIACFIFFVLWAVTSLLINEVRNAMAPLASQLGSDSYNNMLSTLPWAFGVICAIFFVMAIIVVFILDALGDEPEYYYRE
ncbi:unnamed protein product [marine sediment metagenome]|uniref:Uncharacterized protein n=1 Tax=marine sediment metagenome TaxID=412755 RepID=X1BB19_9ZZZZ